MKRPVTVIEAYCDVDYGEQGRPLVPASHVDVPLTIGDLTVNLDMCDACLELAQKTMARFTAAGTTPADRKRQIAPGARDYYRRLRAFADERGISYTTPGGGVYYTKDLKRQFAAYESDA